MAPKCPQMGSPWLPMAPYEFLWGLYGSPWLPMGSLWLPMAPYGLPIAPNGVSRSSLWGRHFERRS